MLFKGKYIIGHILVLIVFITCSILSFWQFSRLSERKELNSQIEAAMQADPVKLDSILLPGDKDEVVDEFEYRRVNVIGNYQQKGEVLILGRSKDQEPGYLVVTPFAINADLSSGNALEGDIVYINRGWIPQVLGDGLLNESISRTEIEPNLGYETLRTVSGLVRANEAPMLLAQKDQIEKGVANRIDTGLFLELSNTSENFMYPLWIQKVSETQNGKVTTAKDQQENDFPKILDLPELTERNHLSYAIQWAIFGIIAIVTWTVICYQAVKKSSRQKSTQNKEQQN